MRPLIDAHRGECGVPGLSANDRYQRAIELGVEYVEIDVRRALDGTYVNYHDETTPAGHAINRTSYEVLRAELGSQAQTLDEVLDIAKTGPVRLHVDLKEPGREPEVVGRLLDRFDVTQVVVTGEDASVLNVKQQFPEVQAGLTLGWESTGATPWRTMRVRLSELFPSRRLAGCHADFVAAHEQLARVRLLAYCARRRMPAWVWTVNDEAEIGRLVRDPRVSVLITDRPDIALRLRELD